MPFSIIEYREGTVMLVKKIGKIKTLRRELLEKIGGASELDALRPFYLSVGEEGAVSVVGSVTITDYSSEEIRLVCERFALILRGEMLTVADYSPENTSVTGTVNEILFERGGGN